MSHYVETDCKVLLEFFSTTVVCGCDAELETFPGEGENGVFAVDFAVGDLVEGEGGGFFFVFVFGGGDGAGGGGFEGNGDYLHGTAFH
jgi:hypothetical protein